MHVRRKAITALTFTRWIRKELAKEENPKGKRKAKAKAKMVKEINHHADVARALKAKASKETGKEKARKEDKAKEKARKKANHDLSRLDRLNVEDGMTQRAPLEIAASSTIHQTVKNG